MSGRQFIRRWRIRWDEIDPSLHGKFRMLAAQVEPALRVLCQGHEVQEAAGRAFAEAAGACYKCGKALLDDTSRERCIGPDCWRRMQKAAS